MTARAPERSMPFTGERYVPGVSGQIKLEHLQRYALCSQLVRGRRVLDIASGEGYGSALLAETARTVVGVDLDRATVAHAREAYRHVGNATFVVGSCDAIPIATGAVDVVVSFETLEHHDRHAEMMREVRRVLAPGGMLVLSTPDRLHYSELPGQVNEFHVKELYLQELEALLRANFRHVALWGQRLAIGSFTYRAGRTNGHAPAFQPFVVDGEAVRPEAPALGGPSYWIAVCSDAALGNGLALDSVIVDPVDDLYHQWSGALRQYHDAERQHVATITWQRDELETLRATSTEAAARLAAPVQRAVELLQEEHRELREHLRATQGEITSARAELERSRRRHEETLEAYAREIADLRGRAEASERARDGLWGEVQAERGRAEAIAASGQARIAALEAAVAEREVAVDALRRELDVLYGLKSFRLTEPIRRVRRALVRLRGRLVQEAEGVLARVHDRLPRTGRSRWRLKSAEHRLLGWLAADAPSARRWQRLLQDSTDLRAHGLPHADDPVVSVVIPVHGQIMHTLRCLASLRRHPPAASCETIVVDDYSPDESPAVLGEIPGIRLLRTHRNLGFIGACNLGARDARGRYLVFLNNDTEVRPGWCDELVRTFEDVPRAGIVGAKLISPDGRLQEAGGIVWRDGSGWNFGRGDDPDRPEYAYRREVDYVSGAVMAIPRELFRDLGGFDEHYAPAYYEDTDLAFRVREAGRVVVYQPRAQVVHDEGATCGRDVTSGTKAFQVANGVKFVNRWRHRLAEQREPGADLARAKERGVARRVLVLDHCTPEPDHDAGSVAIVGLMRILCGLGAKVTFVPEDNYAFRDAYTTDLQRMGVECLYAPYVTSLESYLESHGELFDVVLVHRHTVARRHLDLMRRLCPEAGVVLLVADLHYLREEREATLRGDELLMRRAAATRAAELDVIRAVDVTLVHSTHEEEVLRREGAGHVVLYGWTAEAVGSASPFAGRRDIAFVGGYAHPPNVDAVLHFARDIFPAVRERLPGVRFHVVGSHPPSVLDAIRSDDVLVRGFVPDLGAFLDTVRLTVAPLRYGAGIKGKIITSLSHGVPCVATGLGSEGMPVTPGLNILVADGPAAFADAVVRAYTDERTWTHLAEGGLRFVREHYSEARAAAVVAEVLAKTARRGDGAGVGWGRAEARATERAS